MANYDPDSVRCTAPYPAKHLLAMVFPRRVGLPVGFTADRFELMDSIQRGV
jgi:hypothetical protein